MILFYKQEQIYLFIKYLDYKLTNVLIGYEKYKLTN